MSAKQPFRLAGGGLIDRSRPMKFTFNGREFTGFHGDTLASALLANGVRVVGRGFKFHRPRGVLSAGAEEPNALVCVGRGGLEEPNVRATLQPLYEGLTARSQNCWPGVNFDLGRCLDLAHGLWPAGFYHKTFMWPHWRWYEGAIRRAAGLGMLPPQEDPDHYVHRHAHCDVLIIGTGPAGLAAALAAGRTGKRVILAEQGAVIGGSLRWRAALIDGMQGPSWADHVAAEMAVRANVTLLTQATVSAYFDHDIAIISEKVRYQRAGAARGPRERLWKVRAAKIILAAGAIEQPLIFPYNDRPGVMLASAVARYLGEFAVSCGRRVVIATNNDSSYPLVRALVNAGIEVAGIVDSRRELHAGVTGELDGMHVPIFLDAVLLNTAGTRGVARVTVGRRGYGDKCEAIATLNCDCVAVSGGWQPSVHLLSQARGTLRFDRELSAFVPDQIPNNLRVVGAASGSFNLNQVLREAWEAGGGQPGSAPRAEQTRDEALRIERVFVPGRSGRQWIDFQHDVTLRDIDIAVAENYSSVEHLKRFTTAGMSVDQGKTANLNALIALAARTGRAPGEVGTTTFRPFYLPVTLGALAGSGRGEFYAQVQRSPISPSHESLDAEFVDYGTWRRPAAYPRPGESRRQAIEREAVAARTGVALFDGSPLGKIEVRGRDAAQFVDRVYVNDLSSLRPGRARYGLMLNENGIIMDDGIVARLAEDHFLLHTTSGGVRRVVNWLEALLQGDWPDLEVLLTDVTSQWANVAVSGPRSRELLQALGMSVDLSPSEFPHMHIRETWIGAVPVRLMRAGFSGELSYEINVPADFGASLWDRLLQSEKVEVTPIGVETLMLLRMEKGYLHVGGDTDGTTTPDDIGWGPAIAKKKGEFLGRRSLSRPDNRRAGRLQFVGIAPEDDSTPLIAGAHVLNAEHTSAPAFTEGYVTSAAFSPNLKRHVALGLVRDGRGRFGERVNVFDNGSVHAAMICEPCAWDPKGERLHG